MMDLRIDTVSGDLVVQAGDLALASGVEAMAQRIRDRLLTFRGEWFLDLAFGLPYREDVLVKSPSLPLVSALLKREILEAADEGAEFRTFDLGFDTRGRTLRLSFTLNTSAGTVSQTMTVP